MVNEEASSSGGSEEGEGRYLRSKAKANETSASSPSPSRSRRSSGGRQKTTPTNNSSIKSILKNKCESVEGTDALKQSFLSTRTRGGRLFDEWVDEDKGRSVSPRKEEVIQSSYQLRTSTGRCNKEKESSDGTGRKVTFVEGTSDNEGVDKLGPRRGYDIMEYVVEKQEQRIIPVIIFPAGVILSIGILCGFSLMSYEYGILAAVVISLWGYVKVWNTIIEETLVVTSTLGIQVQQINILGKLTYAKYVPVDNIKAVVINEIIRRQRVISYLLVILNTAESTRKIVVPLLIGTLPRLRTIEKVYNQIQRIIF